MKQSDICPPEQCCGCMACLNICPSLAVSFREDAMGTPMPVIDEALCISCGLCVRACPMTKLEPLQDSCAAEQECYALWTNDPDDRKTCSSGGVATALARDVLHGGGVVFGAAYGDSLVLRHVAVEREQDLERLKGSKYVQSRTDTAYRQAKMFLEAGREVLYIGTPCQIAGLYGFLMGPHPNLHTVDLICHGTPPMRYLQEYVLEVAGGTPVDRVRFRGEDDYVFVAERGGEPIYRKVSASDPYFRGFSSGVICRENCYHCAFANTRRVSDITVGDFWGLDRSTLEPAYDGRVSVLLVNTQRGQQFFARTKERFTLQKRPLAEAVNGNAQLRRPSKCPDDRRIFAAHYPQTGFCGAINQTSIPAQIKSYERRARLKSTKLGALLKQVKDHMRK